MCILIRKEHSLQWKTLILQFLLFSSFISIQPQRKKYIKMYNIHLSYHQHLFTTIVYLQKHSSIPLIDSLIIIDTCTTCNFFFEWMHKTLQEKSHKMQHSNKVHPLDCIATTHHLIWIMNKSAYLEKKYVYFMVGWRWLLNGKRR